MVLFLSGIRSPSQFHKLCWEGVLLLVLCSVCEISFFLKHLLRLMIEAI